jgi:hypothetical protein
MVVSFSATRGKQILSAVSVADPLQLFLNNDVICPVPLISFTKLQKNIGHAVRPRSTFTNSIQCMEDSMLMNSYKKNTVHENHLIHSHKWNLLSYVSTFESYSNLNLMLIHVSHQRERWIARIHNLAAKQSQ